MVCFPKAWVGKIIDDIAKGEEEQKLNKELVNLVDEKNKTIEVQDSLISALYRKVCSQKGIIDEDNRTYLMDGKLIESLRTKNKQITRQRTMFMMLTGIVITGFFILK